MMTTTSGDFSTNAVDTLNVKALVVTDADQQEAERVSKNRRRNED